MSHFISNNPQTSLPKTFIFSSPKILSKPQKMRKHYFSSIFSLKTPALAKIKRDQSSPSASKTQKNRKDELTQIILNIINTSSQQKIQQLQNPAPHPLNINLHNQIKKRRKHLRFKGIQESKQLKILSNQTPKISKEVKSSTKQEGKIQECRLQSQCCLQDNASTQTIYIKKVHGLRTLKSEPFLPKIETQKSLMSKSKIKVCDRNSGKVRDKKQMIKRRNQLRKSIFFSEDISPWG